MGMIILDSLACLKDRVGKEVATTDWIKITRDRIEKFADVTEDRGWIHVDADRAKRYSPYGTLVAHGFLTLSLLSHLFSQAVRVKANIRMGINYGFDRVRFVAPVRVDSLIRAHFSVRSVRDLPSQGIEAVLDVVVETERGEKCCTAEWILRYY